MQTATIEARQLRQGSTIVEDHRLTVLRVHEAYGQVVAVVRSRYTGRTQGRTYAPDAPVRIRVVRDGEW